MTSLDIRISISKLLDYSDVLRKTDRRKTSLLIIEDFAHYIRELYIKMVAESIHSRRYKGKWEPVEDEGYLEYLGTTPSLDILYLIEEALLVEKTGYNFIVSFNKRYKYPGTDLSLVKVLRAIEYGTSEFNPRPILAKIVGEIRGNLLDLWRGYLTMKGIS